MFLPTWIILASLGGLISNAFHFISRFVLKDNDDPTVYTWLYETLKFIMFGIIAFFDWKLILNNHSIVLLILLALTETLGAYWLMKMHAYTQLSISTIIYRTRLIWVAILSFLLFGETLKPYEYLGIIILFIGLSIVVAPKKLFVDKGAIYANLTTIVVALNLVLIKMTLPYTSVSVMNLIMVLPVVILFPIFFQKVRKNLNIFKHENFGLKTLASVFNVITLFLFTIAIGLGEPSKVNAVYQSMMVFSVIAGIVFLKERENINKKLIGTTFALVGALLLTTQ